MSFWGVTPRDQNPAEAAPNHNPRFYVDEQALVIGARTLATLAIAFLSQAQDADPQRPAQPFVTEPIPTQEKP